MSSTPAEIGGYRIERELGRGGMGVVYLAHDPRLGRRVALKVLLDPATDPDAMKRFLVEARAAAKLQHPGIVAVHQVGSEGRNAYLVLDFVEGEGLDARVARTGPLDPSAAASIVAAVADAIEHAHERGILHRDLKPANVLLDRGGQPRVTDFGLARETSAERERLTRTGEVLGTPSYMSPEQALGSGEITPATDVYALGALLYELLTGAAPFTGGSVLAILQRVVAEAPPPPSQVRPGVPAAIERITLQALAKEPQDRYPSAAALARDLRRFEEGEVVEASARPGRRALLVGVLAAVCVGVVLIGAQALAPSPVGAPGPAPSEQPSPEIPVPAATRVADDPPVRSTSGRVVFGTPAKASSDAYPSLRRIAPSAAYRYLRVRLDLGRRFRIGLIGGGRWIVAAPDRRRVGAPKAIIYDAQTWKPVATWLAPRMTRGFATSGDFLARVARAGRGGNRLEVLECDVARGTRSVLARWPCATNVTVVAVSRDGAAVATGDEEGVVRLYSTRAPDREPVRFLHPAAISAVAFDPAGERFLVGVDPKKSNRAPDKAQDQPPPEESLWVWVVANPASPTEVLPPFERVNQIAYSPNGQTVVLGTSAGRAVRFKRDPAGRLSHSLGWSKAFRDQVGKTSPISGAVFDGERLFMTGRRSRQVVTWTARRLWKDLLQRVTLDYEPLGIEVTADREHLLISGSVGKGPQLRGLLEVWSRTPVD